MYRFLYEHKFSLLWDKCPGVQLLGCMVVERLVFKKLINRDFPGDAVVKNPPANAGDTGSSPGLGRSHMPQSN